MILRAAFTAYPDGIEVRAETEYLNAEDYSAASRKTASFATNAHTFWIPKEWAKGGTWMCPRRNYHNGVRIAASPDHVAEARAAYSDFTDGIAKICLLPEYFPTEIYNEYEGQALYVNVERRTNDVEFIARRHDGTGARQDLQTNDVAYVDGQTISLQADTNTLQVFYGTNLVIDVAHGLTAFTNVYANGVCPHYEFQNNWTTNTYVLIGGASCRQSATFGPPEE